MRPWPGMVFLNTGSTVENLVSQIPILIECIVEKFSRNTTIHGTVAVKSFVVERFLRLEKKKNHNIFAFGFDPVEKRKLRREGRADGMISLKRQEGIRCVPHTWGAPCVKAGTHRSRREEGGRAYDTWGHVETHSCIYIFRKIGYKVIS